jgi:ribonuclease E
VENRLRDALHYDRARVQTGKISRFGLLELSRQRLAPSLDETSYSPCPRCNGIGHIRGTESSALNILRIIQEEAMKEHSASIQVQVPIDVATFLLNEKRTDIHRIESRLKVNITLIPNMHLETPHYSVTRLRHDDMTGENQQASYKMVEKPEESKAVTDASQDIKAQRPQAVVQGITPAQPAPMRAVEAVAATAKPSFFGKLFGWLKPAEVEQPAAKPAATKPRSPSQPRRERPEGGNRPGGNRDGSRRERPEGGNKPRRDEAAPRPEKPAQAAPKAQEPRGERPPRPPRPPRVENEKIPALESAPPALTPEQTEGAGSRDGGRKRGRRGGRREREHREQQPAAGGQLALETTGAMEAAHPGVAVEQPAIQAVEQRHTEHQQPQVAERQAEPVAQSVQAVPAPAQVSTPLVSSGLVQIETDPAKRAAVAVVAQPDETTPSGPRRRSRPREVYNMESSEPLVQIETQAPN